MIDISVVAPIYNEESNVEPLCKRLHEVLSRFGRPYEILLVDDGSTDGSWETMKTMAQTIPRLKLIRFRRNFGQTAAMSAGFHHAQGRVIVTMDADLQNDPEDIPALWERMEAGADVVSGWRKDRKDPFWNRRLPSQVANGLISWITGVKLHDYGCTLKAYRREVMEKVDLYGEMHRFIPALASWVGGSVDEVVVRHHPRRFGKSKYGIGRTLRVLLDLMTVSFLMHYSTRPIQIFGKIGLLLGLPGLLMLAGIVAAHFFSSGPAATLIKRPFWIMTPFMLMFFGIQFVSIGLLAELQTRTYHESQDKRIYVVRDIVEPRL